MSSKKLTICLITVLIALFSWSLLSQAAIPEDFVLTANNSTLALYARPTDGQLIVHDLIHDKIWYSNPDVKQIQGFMMLSDLWQGNLQSPVYIDYFDKRRNVRGANAYFGDPEMEFKFINNGFAMSYYFPSLEIGFLIQYQLDGDSLLVTVPWEHVQAAGEAELQLLSIRVLPFFGAQPSAVDYDGYLLVPDGSGGLMRFKELVSLSQTGFNQWVYGLDPAAAEPTYDFYREPVIMPVYGLKYLDQAFLAVMEQGQETAKVLATPGGIITDFNWVAGEFWYSQSIIMRTSRQGSGIRIFDENPIPGDRSVRFYFLGNEQANYVGMAKVYREYLIKYQNAKRLDLSEWPAPMMIQLFGADYETNILGPVMQQMTSFDQAKIIVDLLLEQGIENFVLSYTGWNRLGAFGNLPRRLPAEKALGGNQGLLELAEYLLDLEIPLLLTDDYTVARGTRNGFQASTQASRTAFNDLIKVTTRRYGIGGSDLVTYLISPPISLEFAKRDLPQLAALKVQGITHQSIGENLKSDHNPNASRKIQRRDARQIYQDLLKYTKENFAYVGATTGNAYLIGLVDYITGVPVRATKDTYIDESIPFYQIATHGLITNYMDPINLSTNPKWEILRSIEYGVLPSFMLTAEPSWKLRYTLSSSLYSTYYLDWLTDIVQYYQQASASMLAVHDQFIVNHLKLREDVYLTEYENGIQFVVNYSARPYIYRGVEVAGGTFAVFNKEGDQ